MLLSIGHASQAVASHSSLLRELFNKAAEERLKRNEQASQSNAHDSEEAKRIERILNRLDEHNETLDQQNTPKSTELIKE